MIQISDMMLKDHAKAMKMMNDFMNGWATLEQLKNALQRHFFIEEKAVFSFSQSNDPADLQKSIDLIKEHEDMLKLLVDIEDSKGAEKDALIRNLNKALNHHKQYEDDEFYPALDRNLTDAQKKVILAKINYYEENPHIAEFRAKK
jgi:iron-sulfur cluster repair protein YtfE (RIC family)